MAGEAPAKALELPGPAGVRLVRTATGSRGGGISPKGATTRLLPSGQPQSTSAIHRDWLAIRDEVPHPFDDLSFQPAKWTRCGGIPHPQDHSSLVEVTFPSGDANRTCGGYITVYMLGQAHPD